MKLASIPRSSLRVIQTQAKNTGRTTKEQYRQNMKVGTAFLSGLVVIGALIVMPKAPETTIAEGEVPAVKTEVVVPQPVVETPAPAPVVEEAPAPARTPDMSLAEAKSEACGAMAEYRQYGTALQAMQELESYARYLAIQTGNPSNRSAIYSAAQYC